MDTKNKRGQNLDKISFLNFSKNWKFPQSYVIIELEVEKILPLLWNIKFSISFSILLSS